MGKNLIIIGNGFDLNCGLKSKYLDFFKYQIKKNEWLNNSISNLEIIKEQIGRNNYFDSHLLKNSFAISKSFSFWDLIFLLIDWSNDILMTDQTWTDIESMMKYYLNWVDSEVRDENFGPGSGEIYVDSIKNAVPLILEICLYDNNLYKEYFKNRIDFLVQQLKAFNNRFCQYIGSELKRHKKYESDATSLAQRIALKAPFDIISFNYTSPFQSRGNEVINIHGVASKKEIIFGICLDNNKQRQNIHHDETRVFTKEYQQLGLMTKGFQTSTSSPFYETISIYGLSLNGQDYDFFENLFDRHNLIGDCKTVFSFCYSVYKKEREREILAKFQDDVYFLITRYGDSHNKLDLLTTLMNNNIIQIRKI